MTAEFDKIYLVWRPAAGKRRQKIGLLERSSEGSVLFKYLPEAGELQNNQSFLPYTEFQDINKQYNGNVAEIFGQRLTKTGRSDAADFYRFWEVDMDKLDDKFYLLGKTQGIVVTDNFEFLADYNLTPDTHFLTDLAGLSHQQLPKGTVQKGDVLRFQLEPLNERDSSAVMVFKGDIHLGYVKSLHNLIFHKPDADKLKLEVKAVEQNGIVKQVFVRVFMPQ